MHAYPPTPLRYHCRISMQKRQRLINIAWDLSRILGGERRRARIRGSVRIIDAHTDIEG